MSALGKVCTGFSKPYVALYANNEGAITYSSGQRLARGVEVSIEPESSDASNFYADNIIAETVGGQFTGGTCTLTVDGLLQDAEKLIAGLNTADNDGFINYGLDQATPFVGLGFVVLELDSLAHVDRAAGVQVDSAAVALTGTAGSLVVLEDGIAGDISLAVQADIQSTTVGISCAGLRTHRAVAVEDAAVVGESVGVTMFSGKKTSPGRRADGVGYKTIVEAYAFVGDAV